DCKPELGAAVSKSDTGNDRIRRETRFGIVDVAWHVLVRHTLDLEGGRKQFSETHLDDAVGSRAHRIRGEHERILDESDDLGGGGDMDCRLSRRKRRYHLARQIADGW